MGFQCGRPSHEELARLAPAPLTVSEYSAHFIHGTLNKGGSCNVLDAPGCPGQTDVTRGVSDDRGLRQGQNSNCSGHANRSVNRIAVIPLHPQTSGIETESPVDLLV